VKLEKLKVHIVSFENKTRQTKVTLKSKRLFLHLFDWYGVYNICASHQGMKIHNK